MGFLPTGTGTGTGTGTDTGTDNDGCIRHWHPPCTWPIFPAPYSLGTGQCFCNSRESPEVSNSWYQWLVSKSHLSAVVVHPLVEVVGDVECPVVVGSELVVDEDDRVPGGVIFSHLSSCISRWTQIWTKRPMDLYLIVFCICTKNVLLVKQIAKFTVKK